MIVRDVVRLNVGEVVYVVWDAPCGRTVGDEGVGEEDDGRHVLHGQLSRPESHVEAVRRGGGGYDHERALAVTSVEGLHEVRLLALCRHTRRGTAALYIDDDERKLCDNGQADGFTLQCQTGAGGRRGTQATGERGTDGGADTCDLVFGLHRDHAEVLVLREFVQDVGGGCDGVATEEELQARLLGGGDETVGRGVVSAHVLVDARLLLRAFDAVSRDGGVDVVPIVVAVGQGFDVGLGDVGLLGKLGLEHRHGVVERTVEEPADEAEGEHVLTPHGGLVVEAILGQSITHHRRDGGGHELHLFREAKLLDRVVGLELSLLQVTLGEGVRVDDDDGALAQILDVDLERGGVHGHEHIGLVTGGIDLLRAQMELEARDAEECSLRRANFGRVVGKGGDVVPENG